GHGKNDPGICSRINTTPQEKVNGPRTLRLPLRATGWPADGKCVEYADERKTRRRKKMPTLWFILIAFMLTMYVLLDGFDLGAGVIHLFAAKNNVERRMILQAIGPVWDGNEVWLIAAGGTLFFTFPVLYASSFSGFYLSLFIVLWLLVLRGVAIELRSHVSEPVWISFWDGVFFIGSALLAIFYGVAMANVLRGVPLDKSHYFFEP